ncbi:integrase core domain-containing protein [Enterococcus casseliflavus]|uniref:integrase core domain-containing protein n=1 Tax=Enterococcus casseliflavus TaxID=37734 RepID=UPI0039A50A06
MQANKLLLCHSRKGTPFDNVVMESFYKSLKREVLNKHGFKSKAEAALQLVDYLENYYNAKRIHSSLGYKTPDEFLLSQN